MRNRAFSYYSIFVANHFFLFPVLLLRKYLNSLGTKERYGEIGLVDFNWDGEEESALFFIATKDALELIRQSDLRRFHRVIQEIDYIVNEPTIGGPEYERIARRMSFDFKKNKFSPEGPYYEWNVAQYASLIIHEATHGHLMSRFVPYTRRNSLRIEQICHAEQRRFSRKIKSKSFRFADELVPEFSELKWDDIWRQSPLARLRRYLNNLRSKSNG